MAERKRLVRRWSLTTAVGAAWLLLASTAGAFQFKDEAGKFTVRFPAEPALDKREGDSPSGPIVHYTWEIDIADRHFSVTYTEHSKPPVKDYDKNVKSFLAIAKGKLIRQAKIEQNGVDGVEVVTLLPDNKVMRQRLFQVGNRLYQAVYGGPFGTETRADVETFMQSFKLLK